MELALHLGVMFCIYAILATSFNLLIGFSGLFAFSHAGFYALGAYATAILAPYLGFPLTLVAACAVTGLVGVGLAIPALRISGIYLIIASLTFQSIVLEVIINWPALTGGPSGIAGVPPIEIFGLRIAGAGAFFPFALVVAAIAFAITWRIAYSPFGRALKAMRENESAAVSVGKNVLAMKVGVFGLSAALAAVAGWLFAYYFSYVGPDSFSLDETVLILSMVMVGGSGNLLGTLIGTLLLLLIPQLLAFVDLPSQVADQLRLLTYGLVLIGFLLFRPEGIIPERSRRGPRPAKAAGDAEDALPPVASAKAGEPTLVADDLQKRFGGITAISSLDISLESGRIIGLIGPNGAGKTTAFNLLTGFLKPDKGEIRFRGRTLNGVKAHNIVRAGVGRSFQDLRLFAHMTVLDNVLVALPHQAGDHVAALFLRPRLVRKQERENRERAFAILRFVGLLDRAGDLAEDLSYAEEKLLVIARLLATDAEVLLFDEPLSGLDPVGLTHLIGLIKKLAASGRTIGIIEHNLEAIRSLCDEIVFLDGGRGMARGTPAALMQDPELVERYFQ
jgi:ABC-type branched-subunit amino acid transport system ATPase component/ABC-type branched-subunit amino acid transport system permease subunit